MPRRKDIRSVFVVGSGPIVIGQACEFDYAGAQACKALKAEGLRVILLNSNPATIMTDPEMADATYIEPITVEMAERILAKERPDAMLPSLGGQTGLNLAKELAERGILEKYGCELIGVTLDSIRKAEDRELFNEAIDRVGLEVPKNGVAHSLEEAKAIVEQTGFPAILRPSFTLGGTGGSIAYNKVEFEEKVKAALDASPVGSVLIDESVLGWKEIEVELIRDRTDRVLVVCTIENVDPMGIHTGDSITVAPALTLTAEDHARLRDASEKIIREIGVDSGGCNIQYALDPETGRLVVIEMNPRVSRSSALASKATGYPIAKFSALLAIGYSLEEIEEEAVPGAPATREPAIDFIVTKVPRFAFEKFPTTDPKLSTQMKSVGEAMAFGTTFRESFQKALRSLETGSHGLESPLGKRPLEDYADEERERIVARIKQPTSDRLYWVAEAFRAGLEMEEVERSTTIDPYFLGQIRALVQEEARIAREGIQDAKTLRAYKEQGFSDRRLAFLTGTTEREVRRLRADLEVRASFRRIRAYAGAAQGEIAYLYSTYADKPCDARPTEGRKVMILGGGPNRIGQGIEFDYCCVHASFALEEAGYETLMVNCNPETVSTDWETSDRLYFEPLTLEDVLELARVEKPLGAVVQFGGQTPLKIAQALEEAGIPILGTSPDAIDRAEDRERFTGVVQKLGLLQPENGLARSHDEALAVAKEIGFPVMVRPSYVLGGRAMEICHDEAQLNEYLTHAVKASEEKPVLVDRYLRDAQEVDIDVLCDGERVIVGGVLEHIEEAGVHSGDSACSLPPHSLAEEVVRKIETATGSIARELGVVGLLNAQFAVQGERIYVIEVNPRASRTVPFVAKASGVPLAKLAAGAMVGRRIPGSLPDRPRFERFAVKESVFPFHKLSGVDPVLGPEMKSTGEVMGIDRSFAKAFWKSQLASGNALPQSGRCFISVRDEDKPAAAEIARRMAALGFDIIATQGTAKYLRDRDIPTDMVLKVADGRPHVVDKILDGAIHLVFNTTAGKKELEDSYSIRRETLNRGIPYFTTIAGARAAVTSLEETRGGDVDVFAIQELFGKTTE